MRRLPFTPRRSTWSPPPMTARPACDPSSCTRGVHHSETHVELGAARGRGNISFLSLAKHDEHDDASFRGRAPNGLRRDTVRGGAIVARYPVPGLAMPSVWLNKDGARAQGSQSTCSRTCPSARRRSPAPAAAPVLDPAPPSIRRAMVVCKIGRCLHADAEARLRDSRVPAR